MSTTSATSGVVPLEYFPPIHWPRAAEAVLRAIIDGMRAEGVQRGMQLPRDSDLAKHFGISRIVVREALEQLRVRGIVTPRRGKGGGVFVSEIAFPAELLSDQATLDTGQLRDILEARRCLEMATTTLAAQRATDEDLRSLELLVDQLDELCSARDTRDFIELDIRFHLRVGQICGNPMLARYVTSVLREVSLLRKQFPLRVSEMRRAATYQRELFNAIASHDVAAVQAAADRHMLQIENPALGQSLADLAGGPVK